MTWQLPPSVPENSPVERFLQFLDRNANQHGMPVLPSPFENLIFHCAMHTDEQGTGKPFIMDGALFAQQAMISTQSANDAPLAFRAAAASDNFNVIVCYDPTDKRSIDTKLPHAQQPLLPLLAYAATNDLGIVFLSHRRMFQLSNSTIYRLLGYEHELRTTDEFEAPDDLEILDSTLSPDQRKLFLEMLEEETWLDSTTIEFGTVKLPDGEEYDCATFRLKPGVDQDHWHGLTRQIGEAFTEITGRPFALIPYDGPSLERGGLN